MRPCKLTHEFIDTFEYILNDGWNAAIMTDHELVFELNMHLKPSEQVSYRTFQRYKRRALQLDEETELSYMDADAQIMEDFGMDNDTVLVYRKMLHMIKRALLKMKRKLWEHCEEGGAHWQRYKWLLECKFREFKDGFRTREEIAEERAAERAEKAPQKATETEDDVPFELKFKALHRDMVQSYYEGDQRWWYNPHDPLCRRDFDIPKDVTPWNREPRPGCGDKSVPYER